MASPVPTATEIGTALALAALAAATSALRSATSARSTDHDLHVTFVGLIRRNGHRFLRERTNHLYGRGMAYPQLLHWLLSFVPERLVARFGRYLTAVFAFLSVGAFCAFVWMLDPVLRSEIGSGADELLGPAGLLFVLTPYTYDARDAKNRGLSARGLGLLLGQVYVYACILHVLHGGVAALAVAVACAWAIFLASQFATQFVLFFTPLIALWSRDPTLVAAPLLALGLWFATMPGIASEEVLGQLRKKRAAARSAASRTFLRSRYSVWRDFAVDFWRPLPELRLRASRRRWRRWVEYVYYNPVLRLLTGFPAATVLLVVGWGEWQRGGLARAALGVVAASLAVCFATSFRVTRFLGTPERYMESAGGAAALGAALVLRGAPAALAVLVAASALLVVWELRYFGRAVRERRLLEPDVDARLDAELARLEREWSRELRLLSNNRLLTKRFTTPDRKVFLGTGSERIGRFRYDELFDHEDHLRPERIPDVVREHAINVVLLDCKRVTDPARLLDLPDLHARCVCRAGHVELWTLGERPLDRAPSAVS